MPQYLYQCHKCNADIERFCSIKEYALNPVQKCPNCQTKATRVIEPPMIQREKTWANLTTVDGEDISSRTKHREYMKRNNLVPFDDYKEHWEKARIEREKHFTDGSDDKKRRREDVERATYKVLG